MVGTGVLFVLAVRTIYVFARFSKVERQFTSVQTGDSRDSVVTKIGKPNYHSDGCGVIHAPDKGCATEYVYSHPFAPFIPEYYIVYFSSDGRVINADRWDSP
jgi:hypothetical protein